MKTRTAAAPRAARPSAPPPAPPLLGPSSLLSELPGIGPGKTKILTALGLRTIEDALYAMPLRHEDRTPRAKKGIREGETATIRGTITKIIRARTPRAPTTIVISDDTGRRLNALLFHVAYLAKDWWAEARGPEQEHADR